MSYDDVGNLILDTYMSGLTAGMQYDADNKMTSAANGGQQYRYNADGKRVKRIITGANGGQFWMVYGIGGELVAEYNATSGIPNTNAPTKEFGYRGGQLLIVAESATTVKWLVQDNLGSTRMEIGAGGAIGDVTRHDYLPFGEELTGTMRAGNGYGAATNTKQNFTGYERDVETGLDYAQARYMSSVQGRFTSVDPDGVGADVGEPQSWNGYSYVGNRPTTLTDPSGLIWYRHNNGDGTFRLLYSATPVNDPTGYWEEIIFNGNFFYEKGGHIFSISRNSTKPYDLTDEALREARAIGLEKAHELSEQYVNAIIGDFIFTSVKYGVALGTAGASTGAGIGIRAIAQVIKEETQEAVKGLVLDEIHEKVTETLGETASTVLSVATVVLEEQGSFKKNRKVILADNPDCMWCGLPASRNGKPGHADHQRPRSKGGGDEIGNLNPACEHCNTSRGNRDQPVTMPKDSPKRAQ